MYMIDTVVLSELRKRLRDSRLSAWVERQRATDLFISVITIGEIERGIARQHAIDPRFRRGACGLARPRIGSLRRPDTAVRSADC
jgi:toxin FitB